ncbi:hypothetical protein AB1278_00345 [Chryseobacterium sp. NRRL B-14798]
MSDSVDIVKENGIIITLPTPEIPEDIALRARQKKVNIEFMMVQSKKKLQKQLRAY